MTVTELNDKIVSVINEATDIPFDAMVFVIRSIHTEVEQKYALLKQQMQAQQMQAQQVKSEQENK